MSAITFPELPSVVERLELARVDYLYGDGGRKPVRSTEALAKKYQLDTMQIARHAGAWLAELRANAQSASLVYGRAIDPNTVESYEGDVAWIREQINILQEKMDNITMEGKGLEQYEFLLKQVLKLQTRWSHLSGVEGALKVSTLAKLTLVREEAKIAIAAEMEKPPPPDGSNARPVSGKVFDLEE